MLHLFYLGIMKYMLHALFNYRAIPKSVHDWYRKRCQNLPNNVSSPNEDHDSSLESEEVSKKPSVSFKDLKPVFDKAEFERHFRVITLAAHQQSDRNMPIQEWSY